MSLLDDATDVAADAGLTGPTGSAIEGASALYNATSEMDDETRDSLQDEAAEDGAYWASAGIGAGDAMHDTEETTREVTTTVTETVTPDFPWWLKPAAAVTAFTVAFSVVSYAVGQLFTFSVGGE